MFPDHDCITLPPPETSDFIGSPGSCHSTRSKEQRILGSPPQLPPRVPEGPARPIACFWPRSRRGPGPVRRWYRRGAYAQTLGHALATSATVLCGVGRWHGYDLTPSVCCFGFKDGNWSGGPGGECGAEPHAIRVRASITVRTKWPPSTHRWSLHAGSTTIGAAEHDVSPQE